MKPAEKKLFPIFNISKRPQTVQPVLSKSLVTSTSPTVNIQNTGSTPAEQTNPNEIMNNAEPTNPAEITNPAESIPPAEQRNPAEPTTPVEPTNPAIQSITNEINQRIEVMEIQYSKKKVLNTKKNCTESTSKVDETPKKKKTNYRINSKILL